MTTTNTALQIPVSRGPSMQILPRPESDYLNGLNPEQMAAVRQTEGPCVVESGAGTGKSTLLVRRVQCIRRKKPDARVLLIISFTRKSVDELRKRLGEMTGVEVTTFHSLFYRILRANGYKSYSLMTAESARRKLAVEAIGNLSLTKKVMPDELFRTLNSCESRGHMRKLRMEYLRLQKERHVMDFDTIQIFTYLLLKRDPSVAAYLRRRYAYILIDEFQDTNIVQWEIIKLLAPAKKVPNIFVVGDRRQSIYSFRGSCPEVMDKFQEYYAKGVHLFQLTKNYRCSPEILSLGNDLMERYTPLVSMRQSENRPPVFYTAEDERDEAGFVLKRIRLLYHSGIPYQKMMILYRSSTAVTTLMDVLCDAGIPTVKVNGGLFLDRPLYRFLYAAYRVRLGKYTRRDVHELCLHFHLKERRGLKAATLREYLMTLAGTDTNKADGLDGFLTNLEKIPTDDVTAATVSIWNTGIVPFFPDASDEILSTIRERIRKYESIEEAVHDAGIIRRRYQKMADLLKKDGADYIPVLSIHAAKGLQSSIVFLVGTTDGILPNTSHEGDIDIEEERRLAYVAVTRTQDRLYVSYPKSHNGSSNKPSRFFTGRF